MIKRSPSLTDQVRTNLKSRILANEFDDDRIPSETSLADELGVSRTTIRDALGRLEIEGVIYRKQGAGTFVNRPGLRIRSPLEEIWSYEALLEAHGYTPSIKILSVETITAGEKAAAELDLEGGEQLLVVEKLFLEDREPVILARNHIPVKFLTMKYQEQDLRAPVFEFLENYGGQHLSYYLSELVPVMADKMLIDRLRLPGPAALLNLEEVGYNDLNEPILKAYSYFRDDLLRLRLIRRQI
jgi:GntR family transcriptional regulator